MKKIFRLISLSLKYNVKRKFGDLELMYITNCNVQNFCFYGSLCNM